jgi:hypothetical protein
MFNEDWDVVKSFFPKNWRWSAKRTKALKGLRKDKDPEQLLRALLIHFGCGYSLRETSVRISQAGISNLSDVALLKRLKKSKDWLYSLCISLLRESGKLKAFAKIRELRLVDSTVVREQGATGSLWRIHYSLKIPSLRCDFFKITPGKGCGNGDTLLQYPAKQGDYIIADRGYSQARGICQASSDGACVCVRVNPSGLSLKDSDGKSFSLLNKLRNLKQAGMIGEWDVMISDGRIVKGRICAARKSNEAIRRAQKNVKRRAQKAGEKLKVETLEYAKYIILFTTFPPEEFNAEEVLEVYRLRWQIELIFKRFKQLVQLGHLPKKDHDSIQAWLYGKLFVALLAQRITEHASSFSPWGYDLAKVSEQKSVA